MDTFAKTNPEDIVSSLQKEGKYTFEIDGENIVLDEEDFVIDSDANEGFAMSKKRSYCRFSFQLQEIKK